MLQSQHWETEDNGRRPRSIWRDEKRRIEPYIYIYNGPSEFTQIRDSTFEVLQGEEQDFINGHGFTRGILNTKMYKLISSMGLSAYLYSKKYEICYKVVINTNITIGQPIKS